MPHSLNCCSGFWEIKIRGVLVLFLLNQQKENERSEELQMNVLAMRSIPEGI